MSDDNAMRFLLNGEPVQLDSIAPTTSVLRYLREQCRLTGTKEGCAEGDCGACTVVLAELEDDALKLSTVNACIQFVPTLDGKALFTVEYLKTLAGNLHPVQQAMVDCHGSQCGFCTPGFIMSLWRFYLREQLEGATPPQEELADALSGNLCRCTGYRPILDAGREMFELPPVELDAQALVSALRDLQRDGDARFDSAEGNFLAPRSLDSLVELRQRHPDATILAGCTDVGLWVSKQLRDLGDILYLGEVAELKRIEWVDGALRIGAMASLSDAYAALTEHYPELRELWLRFASLPIRNAGTLGGNVANGSPIGDSMPWLIAVGAQVVLCGPQGSRALPLEDLYTGYMQQAREPDELVEALLVPLPTPGLKFRTYKVSKRYDSDISAVCAAFAIREQDGVIVDCRIAFGGMAATPKRASQCEAAMLGKQWDEATLRAAMTALADDYQPLSDMRASADYRKQTAVNLLYRFFLETGPQALPPQQTSVFAPQELSQ
jgi:xanthine dehydrogenase small subunit